ncbi:hypothetical protein ALC57_12433 [Trachymyrmex cornetzi]|uniref:Uncharacterized protein n=1 Tax=Trachymyrmex cornetzi TaxID=471704 RepID=A0A195DS88_9HYME|nr:hypothetical protein ALC57_12433 [Trachymyrmex cornetzi]
MFLPTCKKINFRNKCPCSRDGAGVNPVLG